MPLSYNTCLCWFELSVSWIQETNSSMLPGTGRGWLGWVPMGDILHAWLFFLTESISLILQIGTEITSWVDLWKTKQADFLTGQLGLYMTDIEKSGTAREPSGYFGKQGPLKASCGQLKALWKYKVINRPFVFCGAFSPLLSAAFMELINSVFRQDFYSWWLRRFTASNHNEVILWSSLERGRRQTVIKVSGLSPLKSVLIFFFFKLRYW